MLEFVKSLGTLTQAQKETRWKESISGSKVAKILGQSPYTSLEEQFLIDMGIMEQPPLSRIAQEKTKMGHILEPIILQRFEEHLSNVTDNFNLMIDKANYQRQDDAWFTGEFDGYGTLNGQTYVVDAKNTEQDFDQVYKTYEWQLRYYMWFGNFDTSFLAVLQNGWKFKVLEVKRDLDLEQRMIQALQYYQGCLRASLQPEEAVICDIMGFTKEIEVANDLETSDLEAFYDYAEVTLKHKQTEATKKALNQTIMSRFRDGLKYKNSDLSVSIYSTTRKGGLDLDLLQQDHPELNFELYRKPDSISTTLRVTPSKAYLSDRQRTDITTTTYTQDYSDFI